ncbi:hypothetical protein EYF80_021425 [Liparis tanakae]|uniref:Uncharacterized protein n=1 Tax=Liparis tanakae TaxID=230148 RepID=A0A4Z2HU14_9TELE|nr:hypothetical protein EYF80_021425 [Liparis tanakae]
MSHSIQSARCSLTEKGGSQLFNTNQTKKISAAWQVQLVARNIKPALPETQAGCRSPSTQ